MVYLKYFSALTTDCDLPAFLKHSSPEYICAPGWGMYLECGWIYLEEKQHHLNFLPQIFLRRIDL